MKARLFLTAEWRSLVMLNYRVEASALLPYLPSGTELDLWNGEVVVSLVGFRFLNTRLLGVPILFHRDFDEVNLRFYVRRQSGDHWRRGVTFLREIVPRRAIAWTARLIYNEPYVRLPMRHSIGAGEYEYMWKCRNGWCGLGADVSGPSSPIVEGSEEEFIFEHYWGYNRQRNGSTLEYEVEHPRWNVWRAERPRLIGEVPKFYGVAFAEALSTPPCSAFVADGSEVVVRAGVPLRLNGS